MGIPLAAWITAGQRAAFAANLESFLTNFSRHGHEIPVLIGDDGTDDRTESELLRIHQGRPELHLYLSGFRERLAFIESLPSRFDHGVVRDAMCVRESVVQCGSNRNTMLLCAAGRPLVMTDDDIECRPAHWGNPRAEVGMVNEVHRDIDGTLASVIQEDRDLLSEHLAFLANEETRICSVGFYGAAGSTVNRGVLSLEDVSRDLLLKNGYTQYRDAPYTVRISAHDRVSADADFMAAHASYDCITLLPPFYTSGRNDDGLFAFMVRLCDPASKTAYPSFGLFHNPDTTHHYSDRTRVSFFLATAELFMALCAWASRRSGGKTPAGRMEGIGAALGEVAGFSANDMTDLLFGLTLPSLVAYEEHLEALLSRYRREPAEWAHDVDILLDNVREKEREPALMYGPSGCGLSPSRLQDELRRYGLLLQQWPSLWEYARERNADGPCLARELQL